MIYLIFILLSLLNALEFSNNYARSSGVRQNNLGAGYVAQNSVNIFSRVLNALMIPILAISADTGIITYYTNLEIFISILILPLTLSISYLFRHFLKSWYEFVVNHLILHGRINYWGFGKAKSIKNNFNRKFSKLYIITLLIYIPYYLSWPLAIFMMTKFIEFRTTFLSLTTVLISVNTLFITFCIDPYIVSISKRKTVSINIIENLIVLKLAACWISFIFMLIYGFFFTKLMNL